MLVKVKSAANYGIETIGVDVEVNVASRGFPSFDIVGLASKAVEESKQRVKTALLNSGFDFPNKKITVNLAPADIPKAGSFYDLPIAVGIMAAVSEIPLPEKALYYGELSLDGGLRHTNGSFLVSLYAQENNYSYLFVPNSCINEASVKVSEGGRPVAVVSVGTLGSLFAQLSCPERLHSTSSCSIKISPPSEVFSCDMVEILGQEQAKRALEICAAGGHNLLMVGPPGGGKTMLAKALPSILPPLEGDECLDVTRIYSAAGHIPPGGSIITSRQCRTPHHTISRAGLIGGGLYPKPGEISLAHRGVLFMDEFPEYSRFVIESLRQPLEDNFVTISRSGGVVTFPCNFILIAAANPCPCGYLGHSMKRCLCTARQIERYRKKLSGPILDRIDLHIFIPAVSVDKLTIDVEVIGKSEKSSAIRKRVQTAREIQKKRFRSAGIYTNSEMSNAQVRKFCRLDSNVEAILKRAISKFNLSARAYFKLIKISRTIADLVGESCIQAAHMAEAIQYRSRI